MSDADNATRKCYAPHRRITINECRVFYASDAIRDRVGRETKVVEALRALRETDMAALVAKVYDDVPVALHPMASRSLLAHLIKLKDEGRAGEAGGRWRAKS